MTFLHHVWKIISFNYRSLERSQINRFIYITRTKGNRCFHRNISVKVVGTFTRTNKRAVSFLFFVFRKPILAKGITLLWPVENFRFSSFRDTDSGIKTREKRKFFLYRWQIRPAYFNYLFVCHRNVFYRNRGK